MTPEKQYEQIKNPINFVKVFRDDKEFVQWCEEGTIHDLYCTLEAFKVAKLYWHCLLISNVIREKKKDSRTISTFPIAGVVPIDGHLYYGLGALIRIDSFEFEYYYN